MLIAPLVFMASNALTVAPIQRGERIKPTEVSGQPRQVTGSYFRMNDLDFVARVADRKDSNSKSVFNSVLGKELSNRAGEIVLSRKATMGIPRLAPIKIGKPNGTPNDKQEKPKPIKLGGSITVDIEIPAVAQSSDKFVYSTTRYYGESNFSNGKLSITDTKGTAIEAIKLTTYTGELKDGTVQVDASKFTPTNGDSISLKTNQSYSVLLKLDAKKQGDYAEEIVLDEGGRKVTLRVKGKVLAPAAQFAVGSVDADLNITPGKSATCSVSVTNTGSKAVTVSPFFQGLSGFSASGSGKTIQPGQTVGIPITVIPGIKVADGEYQVPFNFGAPGSASSSTKIPVKVSTVWTVWEGIQVSGSKSKINGTFRYSNSGYWDLTTISQDSSTLYGDAMALAVWINLPNSQSKKFGTYVGCYAGAGNTSVDTEFGQDADLAKIGDKFMNAPCKARGIFEGQFSGSTYVEDQLTYWFKEQNVQVLTGTSGAYVKL